MLDNQPTAKHTLTLPRPVYDALKRAAIVEGLEPYEVMQRLITDYVIEKGTLDGATKEKVLTGRRLIAGAVEMARRLCREDRFSTAITLDTFRECLKDPKWAADYRSYVEDDIYKHGNPLKGINKEIGFRIRAAIGGVVSKGEKPVRVSGEVIQSYTAMSGFDRGAVA